ncbi:prolactin [Cavia porcellus]|uniref:Prolactin n=1 Tax=Cavia porcellus TaxID=10141 RepID=A0A0M6L0P6_CAVPO|nr:prolactin-like [Cavia porcellus]CDW51458.1 TPA: growth hormone C2 [Cavia porcellus]
MFMNSSKVQNQRLNLDQGQPGLLHSRVLPVLIITMNANVTGSLTMLLLMSSLLLWKNAASQSNYTTSTGSNMTISKLLNRATILSSHISLLSSELYKEFVARYSLDIDIFSVLRKRCHTASIATPGDKEETLKMKERDLIILMIHLMLSWEDAMCHMKAQGVHLPNIPLSFMQKAELIQQKIWQLLQGLTIIARQVDLQFKDYGEHALWNELPLLMSTDARVSRQTFYQLCHCLRRDTDKVHTFLRVLNYQITHERQS